MRLAVERRLVPLDGPTAVAALNGAAVLAALLLGGLLFLPFGADPVSGYADLVGEAFLSWRGLGFTLVQATPLALVALGTVVAWRAGFAYLGFEGCLLVGAVAAAWLALLTGGALPGTLFFPLAVALTFAAGGAWAGLVGLLRARFGGNEVLISLMANYVAAYLVQYLVSGPMRAGGDLPQTPLLPRATWLPLVADGSRAHWGVGLALLAAVLVWLLLERTRPGLELIITGLNPRAALYGGIAVGRRHVEAAVVAGGLGALAGLVEILGNQHRLMDGLAQGTGFVGIVAALLGKLSAPGAVLAAVLYGGLGVGGSAMQRHTGLPSSIVLVIQALIVLAILASDALRYWRLRLRR